MRSRHSLPSPFRTGSSDSLYPPFYTRAIGVPGGEDRAKAYCGRSVLHLRAKVRRIFAAAPRGFCYNFGLGMAAVFPWLVGELSASLPLGRAIGIYATIAYATVMVAALDLLETKGRSPRQAIEQSNDFSVAWALFSSEAANR